MARQNRTSALSASTQDVRKEQVLTQHEPAKIRQTIDAIVLKQDSLFLLTAEDGDIPWQLPHGLGLFYRDCRFLDGYTLTLNGCQPVVLSSSDRQGFDTTHHLSNPELPDQDGRPAIRKNTIAVRRERLIHGGVVYEVLCLRNHGRSAAQLQPVLNFRARFEDLFVIKGFVREVRGKLRPPFMTDAGVLTLRYDGRDGICRATAIRFSRPPARLEAGRVTFRVALEPGCEWALTVSITVSEYHPDGEPRRPARPVTEVEARKQVLRREEEMWLAHSAEVHASNPLFDRVLQRALCDLRLLRSTLNGRQYFAAGVPWFVTLFGRDTATVAIQTLPYRPTFAREILQLLAHYQAREADPCRDAEPGKILHELRRGELARLGAIPQSPAYYGTVDATLLFLILLAEYVNWSGDVGLARTLRPNVDAALRWIECYADHDGDGYIDYVGEYENGLVNQGWKDSGNAIVNADGSFARPPIALCEVQAYLYRAWVQTAALFRLLDNTDAAAQLERRACELHSRFVRDFWSEELGCYVMARQQAGRPAAVVSSNTGQVLWGGIATPEHAGRVVERLMAPDMFSGWGIRTLSSAAVAYNPMSYHLGSVWPHDNGLIIGGFCRYGHEEAALRVFDALFSAASQFRSFRLPELFCGYEKREGEDRPVRYPVACSPQAWAAGALPHALWNLLGLRANARERYLQIIRPRLPEWLDWIELKSMQVGEAKVDLHFERARPNGAVQVEASVRAGQLSIEQTEELPSPTTFCG
jgi:glycogen debranching enzyme